MTNPMNNQPWQQPSAPQPVQSSQPTQPPAQYPQMGPSLPPQQPQFSPQPAPAPKSPMAKSLSQYKTATIILGISTGVLILLSLVLFSAWAVSGGASSAADSSEGDSLFSSAYDVCNDSDVLQLDDDEETLSMEADTDDAYGPYQCLVGALGIPEEVQDEIEGDDDTGGASFDGITVRWRFTDDDNLQMTFKLTDGE